MDATCAKINRVPDDVRLRQTGRGSWVVGRGMQQKYQSSQRASTTHTQISREKLHTLIVGGQSSRLSRDSWAYALCEWIDS